MYLQNVRSAEYNRQAAKMMIVTMQLAIAEYFKHKAITKNKIPRDVEKAIHQLQHDMEQLLEDINDENHRPKNGTDYLDRAMALSERKTGAKHLDSGHDDEGVLSLRKLVVDALDEFETEYKEGTDLEIESNRMLALSLIRTIKDTLEDFRVDPSTQPLPSLDLYEGASSKKGFFSFESKKPEPKADVIEDLYSKLCQLEMAIEDNQVPVKNQGLESEEDRKDRHDLSMNHLEQVDGLSTKLTGRADVDTALKKAVADKVDQWKNNTSKAPPESAKYHRQDTNFSFKAKK